MKNFHAAIGATLLMLSLGVRANDAAVSNEHLKRMAAGAGILWGTESLFSGAHGGTGPSLAYDFQTLKRGVFPKELLDKEIARKAAQLRAERVNLKFSREMLTALREAHYPKLSTSQAGRLASLSLLETSSLSSTSASAREAMADIAKRSNSAYSLHEDLKRLAEKRRSYAKFGSGRAALRATARWVGWVAGGAILLVEGLQTFQKWDAETKTLREPSLEDLAELRRSYSKVNRRPAVLTGANGSHIEKKFAVEGSDHESSGQSH